LRKQARERSLDLHDVVEADDDLHRRWLLAATIGMHADISGQQGLQPAHIAAAGSGEEGRSDRHAALPRHIETRAGGTDMRSGPAGKLAACSGLATDCLGDLLKNEAEHVMPEEGGGSSGGRRSSASISGSVTSSISSSLASTTGSGSQGPT
jgi:hypothetical protein